MIKAAAGGGGKGIRLVEDEGAFEGALRVAAAEALASFNDDGLYIERYLSPVRHIEVQVLGDSFGNVVHLGERECSIQRRSQKLVEESPSAAVSPAQRAALGTAAVAIAREARYENAGTVEFLLDEKGDFYFIEANARLQVEHPVTELVTGLDLVREQLRVAAGEPLGFTQDDVAIRGSAIECRITAEDAAAGFLPSLGVISHVSEPSGPGVRVDSSLFEGLEIGPSYDSLVSKLVVWGADRTQALARLRRALDEYQVLGVRTTIGFHRALADDPNFIDANIHTRYLDTRPEPEAAPEAAPEEALVIAALLSHERRGGGARSTVGAARSGWKAAGREDAVNRYGGGSWRNTF
jgi:acetyl/propionyl-CoA carboxylase alpha subunit